MKDDPIMANAVSLSSDVSASGPQQPLQAPSDLELKGAALDAAADPILIVDRDAHIVCINKAFEQLTGYSADELVGQTPHLLDSGEHDQAFYQYIRETAFAGKVWRGEIVACCKNDSRCTVELAIAPIRNETGEITHFIAITSDISRRKQAEAEMIKHTSSLELANSALEQAHQEAEEARLRAQQAKRELEIAQEQLLQSKKLTAIGQLAAGIAHEINTPMQYVGDNIQYLQTCFEKLTGLLDKYDQLFTASKHGTKTTELLAEIEEAIKACRLKYLCKEIPEAIMDARDGADTVSRIVRAMKEFSHPGVEGKTNIDINRAIESTIMVARNEWKYVAEVETDFDTELPPVPCLANEFNEVILNILVNAAHAIGDIIDAESGDKGTITVSTHRRGNWAEIRMRDTGPGIPPEVQSRIFDPFFTTKQVGQGTGQGLAISHNVVVEKHGGTITFETEPGNGTTFIIRLPISTEDAEKDTEINAEVIHAG